ncbi:MAG TPA: ABC transporter permease, partial [Humisphaera sp.]
MSALGRLSPFGPIFTKELRVGARRKRTYALRVGYLAVLLLALLGAYGSVGIGRAGGVAAQAERQQALGFAFFTAFTVCLMGTMTIVAPVLTANAIGAERLARTLPVLLMTPITSWQVVGGKLFSRLLTALTLVGLSLPVLAMVRLLGGVELWQMGAVIGLAVSFAVGSAAIGQFYSLFISRPAYVILLAYATLGFLYVLLPVCAIAILHPRRPPTTGVMQTYIALNPGMAVASVVTPMGRMVTGDAWAGAVAVQLALGAALTAWTAALLRRQARRQGERPDGA